jgi:hypothetical protein
MTDDKLIAEKVKKEVDTLQKAIAEKQSELMSEKKLAAQALENQV